MISDKLLRVYRIAALVALITVLALLFNGCATTKASNMTQLEYYRAAEKEFLTVIANNPNHLKALHDLGYVNYLMAVIAPNNIEQDRLLARSKEFFDKCLKIKADYLPCIDGADHIPEPKVTP